MHDYQMKTILPCYPEYGSIRQVYNRSIQRYPTAIVRPENQSDVAATVLLAREQGLKVRVRSGGHHHEGFCVGDGVVLVDTCRLKKREIDQKRRIVRIGAGVTNEELYEFLGEYGYPFPSGTCPTVCASGLTMGGGWGHSARQFGLACDRLVEVEMVDALGNEVVANKNSHPNLFWAMRGGGGGNFGVAMSFAYRLPPKLFDVTYVDVRYSQVSAKLAESFLHTWQQWLRTASDKFTPNSRIFHCSEKGMGIFLRGFFYGGPDEAKKEVQPFVDLGCAEASFQEMTFLEATRRDASFYPPYALFRFGGRFVRGEFSKGKIEEIVDLVKERPDRASYVSVALYALGGKVRDLSQYTTAFFYRDADYIIGVESVWEEPEAKSASLSWFLRRFAFLRSITEGAYVNFPCLLNKDYMRDYYGDNVGRLQYVKRIYDPSNLFCFPQGIPTW